MDIDVLAANPSYADRATYVLSIRERNGASDVIVGVFDEPDALREWLVARRHDLRDDIEWVISVCPHNPVSDDVPAWIRERYGAELTEREEDMTP